MNQNFFKLDLNHASIIRNFNAILTNRSEQP